MEETLNEALEEENGVRAKAPAQETVTPVVQEQTQEQPKERFQITDQGNPIANIMEEGAVAVRDFIDNTFQGDLRSKEEIKEDRDLATFEGQQAREEAFKTIEEDTSFAAETGKALVGGVATAVENIGEGAEFIGDTWKGIGNATGITDFDATQIPWSASYESAHWDLGTAKNQTVVGNFAREGLGILINIRQLGALGIGQVGVGQTVQSRLATEAARGMIVDFLIDPGEGNLSNMVQDSKYANLFSQALAHEEDDNQYIRRLKNMAEGGVMGLAVDGIGELYGALRAGKKAIKAGVEPEKAADIVVEEASKNVDVVENKIDFLDDEGLEANMKEEYAKLAEEYEVTEWLKEDGFVDAAEVPSARLLRFEDAQSKLTVDSQMRLNGKARKDQVLPNGNRIKWYFDQDDVYHEGLKTTFGDSVLEVSWSIENDGMGMGTSGKRLLKFFNNLAKSELPAGTVLFNSPVDSFDSPAARKALFNRPDIQPYLEQFKEMWIAAKVKNSGWSPEGALKEFEANFQKAVDANDGHYRYYLDQVEAMLDHHEILTPDGKQVRFEDIMAENSPRARLYEAAGFGKVQGGVSQFGIVRGTPDAKGRWIQPVEGNPFEDIGQSNAFKNQVFETKANKAEAVNTKKVENDLNSARSGEEGTYEPHERASTSNEADIEDVAVTQATDDGTRGAHRNFNDNDWQDLNTVEDLSEFIKEKADWIDIDDIVRRLGDQGVEYKTNVVRNLTKYASDGALESLDDLRFTNTQGINGVDAGGAVALDVMVNDAAMQIVDLADNLMEVADIDGDFTKQASMILERSEALMKLKKEATIFSSYNLQNWKDMPLELTSATKEADAAITKHFEKMKAAFASSNPEDVLKVREEFKQFAYGLRLTNGDPTKIANFWGTWYKFGFQNLNKAIIQSWLSSPLTQVRNIAGNAFVAAERPLAIAVDGVLHGNRKQAVRAFSMFDSFGQTLSESFKVARESLNAEQSITGGMKFHDFATNTQKDVDSLVKTASTTHEQWAANSLKWYHDISNSPWVSWPGKGLQGGDDFFKSLVARMDLRYQAAIEADLVEGVNKGDKYKELLNKKIGPKGEILDDELLRSAKEATFQRELSGKMKKIADSINDHPEIKTFIPFVKTPHNINVYAVQHIPGLARFTQEYTQAMKTGTDMEKAIMRGREAIGFGLITMAFAGAANDGITGNGPADAELRKIWRRTHEPMSIRIPGTNKWISYKSLPGAEMVMSAVADTVQIAQMLPEGEAGKLLAQLGYTIANAATNRSYFKGFTDLAIVFDTQNYGKNIANILGDRVNAAVPLGGARQQFENALRPGMEEYRNTLHMITSKLTGGIVGDTIPVVDILTGEQMVTGYEGVLNSLNPFRVSTKSASPLVHVLADLEYELPDVMVTTHKGLSLTTEEQQFIRKEMYAGGEFPKALTRYLKTPRFKKLYDEWEANKGTAFHVPRKEAVWYGEISKIVNKYKIEATRELAKSNPQFKERLNQHKIASKGIKPTLSGAAQRVEDSLNELADFSQ